MQNEGFKGSFPPWSRIPSLKEMTEETGIDFDKFVDCIKEGVSTVEMASMFDVSSQTIENLRGHFYKYGISSVMGGD
ncbi:MAG: helix-turn-helix domain-containing protein [Syntrophomonadaceae bacterium]|nr:helix-turn-helix domain-containing protein [Syntrophomonadaceae bacterium]MDD3889015.1 helix-turn-helix domain-containing protein [Syntrophomonadaceae bacterium]MDD4548286.1 helix-turn-helix domain-containing protein [Syntrophomonadaceae bacterium]